MNSQLHDLDRCLITSLDVRVLWQGDLREADGARVGAVGGTEDLNRGHHRVRHVFWSIVGAVCAKAQVDI